jgi:5-methylcytosine-specific restriction endonuclease McrA
MVCKGTACVEIHTNVQVHKGIYLPSVIRLMRYRRVPSRLQIVSRRNIIIRDSGMCMYCGKKTLELTLDHIIPRSRGGLNTWENLVAACGDCNRKKGDRTPAECDMPLIRRPLPQTVHTSRWLLRTMGSEANMQEWSKYLWHDSEGDKRYTYAN